MNEITALIRGISEFGITGIVVLLILLSASKKIRLKIFNGFLSRNGDIKKELQIIQENHLHQISEKLDKMIELQVEHNHLSKSNQDYLKDKIRDICSIISKK